MVGFGAHGEGEKCAPREKEGEPCGTPQCVMLRDLSDETFGEGYKRQVLESLLLGLRPAVTVGSGKLGEGSMEETRKDGEGERFEGEIVRRGCRYDQWLSVGGVWRVGQW